MVREIKIVKSGLILYSVVKVDNTNVSFYFSPTSLVKDLSVKASVPYIHSIVQVHLHVTGGKII